MGGGGCCATLEAPFKEALGADGPGSRGRGGSTSGNRADKDGSDRRRGRCTGPAGLRAGEKHGARRKAVEALHGSASRGQQPARAGCRQVQSRGSNGRPTWLVGRIRRGTAQGSATRRLGRKRTRRRRRRRARGNADSGRAWQQTRGGGVRRRRVLAVRTWQRRGARGWRGREGVETGKIFSILPLTRIAARERRSRRREGGAIVDTGASSARAASGH